MERNVSIFDVPIPFFAVVQQTDCSLFNSTCEANDFRPTQGYPEMKGVSYGWELQIGRPPFSCVAIMDETLTGSDRKDPFCWENNKKKGNKLMNHRNNPLAFSPRCTLVRWWSHVGHDVTHPKNVIPINTLNASVGYWPVAVSKSRTSAYGSQSTFWPPRLRIRVGHPVTF